MKQFNQQAEMNLLRETLEQVTSLTFSIDDSDPSQHVCVSDQSRIAVGICDFNEYLRLGLPHSHNYQKTRDYKAAGKQLTTLWQYEWTEDQVRAMNFIQSQFGVSKSIMARKCQLRELEKTDRYIFDDNHIQKASNVGYAVGATFEGQLVSGMSFAKHHRQNAGDLMTLTRFSCTKGINVAGGPSRLLKYAIEQNPSWIDDYDAIVTFSHNRLSAGKVYSVMDAGGRKFTLDEKGSSSGSNKFDYIYYNPRDNTYDEKQNLQKKVLFRRGPTFGVTFDVTGTDKKVYSMNGDPLNEEQMAAVLGYRRIYDSGKTRFVMSLD